MSRKIRIAESTTPSRTVVRWKPALLKKSGIKPDAILWNDSGKGPTDSPPKSHKDRPRKINMPARVTIKAGIDQPTLITWGRDDRVSPLDMALLPMRLIPRAELHVFPNCGHWAMIECKEAFETLVLGFLSL